MNTRTYYAEISAKEMRARVTLAGPCTAAPITTPQWTRPVTVEPNYRSVVATKVMPPKACDKFGAESFTPAQMIAAVKAESDAFHFAAGRERMQRKRVHGKSQKQIEFENRILAALVGEMAAYHVSDVVGSRIAATASALGHMVDDGRVTCRQQVGRGRYGLVKMYRRAAILEITEVTP